MIHHLRDLDRDRVKVKSMSMSKLYSDEIRYDLYYNCSGVLTYFNETPRHPASRIIDKFVKRLNETRYDLVKIFNDSFSLDERYGKYYNNEVHEFEDIEFEEESNNFNPDTSFIPGYLKKALTGACSFLFIGILKFASSMQCVKDMAEDDEDKIKGYRKKVSEKFDSHLTSFFGDE